MTAHVNPAEHYVAKMYNPPYNRVEARADAFDLVERARFGHVVTHAGDGFSTSGLPLLLDRDAGASGTLRGHFARANRHWRAIDGADALVLFPLTDGYVSPTWYPTKAEHGKVVPTWNYEVVHVHGVVQIHDDIEWVRRLVSDLTDHHESARARGGGAAAWEVTDAPADFITKQLRAIVGIEIEITSIEAKRKLSQNRSEADHSGVIAGLAASNRPSDQALAETMRPEE